jgi:isoprenylcysteine carboxyl methyltransferase (ICMT) family protein YpbQ
VALVAGVHVNFSLELVNVLAGVGLVRTAWVGVVVMVTVAALLDQ